jgi:malonyl-CoA/methylmalonyl-CoA synthetase
MPDTAWTPHLPPGIAPEAVDLTAGGSLAAAIVASLRAAGPRPTICDVDGRWLSADWLDHRSLRAAGGLQRAGLQAGDRVVLCAGTSVAMVTAFLGAVRAGLVVVPINRSYTRVEVQRIVAAARPAAAIVEDGERAGWIEDAPVLGLELDAAAELPLDAAGLEDPVLMLYTSGTTGAPKGALLSHGNVLASARAIGLAWRWTPADRLLLALPLFHIHGLGIGLCGALAAGGQLVLRPRFDAGDVAEHCSSGTTMFFGVPAMYQRLLAGGHAGALASLRLIVSGSAPLSAAQSDAVAAAAGQRPLERYGMTETLMLTSNLIGGPRKPGKVGLPLPGVELRLGDGGEVEVRGPNVFAGYDNRPDATAEAFAAGGWFRTGDLGEFDGDGHLQLVGRSKELIISGGFNVHPREVEEAVAGFPGIVEVAVIGRPSEQWGEVVTAVVVAADGVRVEPEAVRAHASQLLAPYKVPKEIEFIDALPRNALGKIVRREL